MPEAVEPSAGTKNLRWSWALRLIGLALLSYLLYRLNLGQVTHLLGHVDLPLVIVALFLTVPLIWLKTIRWQIILRAQGVRYGGWSAFLAYFGSLFIGFLTPGRLGEFVKAFHVQRECNAPLPLAVSSVLADRLFDLFALIAVGTLAVLTLSVAGTSIALAVVTLTAVIATLLLLFLNPAAFGFFQQWAMNWGRFGKVLFGPQGWLTEIHSSLRRLKPLSLSASVALTILAYAVFFGQNYLLAVSLGLDVGFWTITCAVALGSLITLLPISISGLGTREAVMITYLGIAGVSSEAALSFSLLVFFTFYVCGGLMGLVAWLIKPLPWSVLRARHTQLDSQPSG
jgi:uncharacterized membrane protein YbhN (UPF0104 family)